MIYGLIILIFLFLCLSSIKFTDKGVGLTKENTNFLKIVCALFILIHHIAFEIKDLPLIFTPIKYMAFVIVGLFLFLSGYGLMSGLLAKEDYLKGFMKKRFSSLLIPYGIVIFIFGIYKSWNNTSFNVISYLKSIFLATEIGPLWYMTVIFILYFLFWFIFKYFKEQKGLVLFGIITFLYIIILSYFDVPSQWFSSIIGFWFGLYFKKNENKINSFLKKNYVTKLTLFFILFSFFFIARLLISYKGFTTELVHGPYRNLVCILFILVIIMLQQKINWKNGIIRKFENLSYEIYLVHPFILLLCKKYLSVNSIAILLVILFSLIGAFFLHKINFLLINLTKKKKI